MPRIVNFANKQIIEPGVYSQIKGLVPAPIVTGTYGNVMIIDTGSGAGYGGGSAINGELVSDSDETVYEFANAIDFKRFVRGGLLYDLIDYLFSPSNNGAGPNRVFYSRAGTSIASKFTINFESYGSVQIAATNEGSGSNGIVSTNDANIVTRGYGWRPKAGVINASAFIIEFYEGQYRGTDDDGIPYDGIYENAISLNTVIAKSPEFTNADQIIAWMKTDSNFKNYFTIISSTSGTTTIPSSFLTTYSGTQLLSGGVMNYSSSSLDTLLETIVDLDVSMFLCDDYGITPTVDSTQIQNGVNKGALSVFNQKILAHVLNDATYGQKALYIGGGQDSSEYSRPGTSDGTEEIAVYYNNPSVIIHHSAVKIPATVVGSGQTFKYVNSLYHAALVCGRTAGLIPQVSTTYKDIRIIGLKHQLKKSQRERALQKGIIHERFIPNLGWVVNQMVNTMQNNSSIILNDGTSPEVSIMRIIHQLNKELVLSLGASNFIGGNLKTASDAEIKAAVEGYLVSRCADAVNDNLIISFQKVQVILQQDSWDITYCVVPNSPINRIFATGFLLDPSINL